MHIIFMMSVKNVSLKPFVSQKQYYLQCLTQGEIYPRDPCLPADLLTCVESAAFTPLAHLQVGFAHAMVANRHSIVVNAHYSAIVAHLK